MSTPLRIFFFGADGWLPKLKAAGCELTVCFHAIIEFMQRSASTTPIALASTANATAARAAAAPAA